MWLRRWAKVGATSCFVMGSSAYYFAKRDDVTLLEQKKSVYDVAVVGGGIVGLAVARECAVRGYSVVLLEKEDAFAAGASSGNSGLGCTGYDAPVGSLERRLLRRSIQLHQHLYRSFGLSHQHVRKSGSLVVAWDEDQLKQLPKVLEENREAGDMEAVLLTKEELMEYEPGLSKEALGAVLCPYEAVVEPWLVPMGYVHSARLNGAELWTNCKLESVSFDEIQKQWNLQVTKTTEKSTGRSEKGKLLANIVLEDYNTINNNTNQSSDRESIQARVVINCAGLYGDKVEAMSSSSSSFEKQEEKVDFTITPRKGQFVVFKPKADSPHPVPMAIIEPVATQFTKGVIAWTTVYGNIIVGPTAVDQQSRTDRSTDMETIESLRKWGEKIIPAVRDAQVVGTYSGLRPATEHRDYQIKPYPQKQWISVSGIRSTGLTGSSGIGEYVANLHDIMLGKAPASINDYPYLGVSEAAKNPIPVPPHVNKTKDKVPTLQELAQDYQKRQDGTIRINGTTQRVTHPIASFGMETHST